MGTVGSWKTIKRPAALRGVEFQTGFAAADASLDNFLENYLVVKIDGSARFRYRGEQFEWNGQHVGLGEPGEFIGVSWHSDLHFSGWYIAPELMQQAAEERSQRVSPRFSQDAIRHRSGRGPLVRAMALFERATEPLDQQEGLARLLDTLLGGYVDDARVISDVIAHRAVRRMRDLIRERYAEQLSLDDLSAAARLNKFYALRAFKRAMGVTPHGYQRQVRIAKACEMLRAGVRGAEIAQAVGFFDQSHLARSFHEATLVTPRQYQLAC